MDIRAYILAGGQSSRMGTDKAAVQLDGRTLIEIALAKAQAVCKDVTVLRGMNGQDLLPGVGCIADHRPSCGPVGGIEAALGHSDSEWNLVLPVDAPLIPTDLLRRWLGDVTVRTGMASILINLGVEQPLPLLIHRSAQESVARFLQFGKRSVFDWLSTCRSSGPNAVVKTPAETYQVQNCVSAKHWFLNVNDRSDLQMAEEILNVAGDSA